jgi:hypothetical protein
MNVRKWVLMVLALLMMGGSAGLLAHVAKNKHLGLPGVTTHPLTNSIRLEVDLPEKVLDYESEKLAVDEPTSNTLPADTSFGVRLYKAPDGFQVMLNVVLMGTDRTSLHKPQFCLEGQGWHIDPTESLETTVKVERPLVYDLPVVRLVSNREWVASGQKVMGRGVYVYWYVADNALSASTSGFQRMWWMARELVRTGVLQRWAYVSCFAVCAPGQEEATFERQKKFIAAAAPDFQLTPGTAQAVADGRETVGTAQK